MGKENALQPCSTLKDRSHLVEIFQRGARWRHLNSLEADCPSLPKAVWLRIARCLYRRHDDHSRSKRENGGCHRLLDLALAFGNQSAKCITSLLLLVHIGITRSISSGTCTAFSWGFRIKTGERRLSEDIILVQVLTPLFTQDLELPWGVHILRPQGIVHVRYLVFPLILQHRAITSSVRTVVI